MALKAHATNPNCVVSARAAATLLVFEGQLAQAAAVLKRAARSAASQDLPGAHWQILAALAWALEAAGDAATAQSAREQARAIVGELAAFLLDATDQQTFLNGANRRIERAGPNVAFG